MERADKIAGLRALIEMLRQQSADPALWTAIKALAATDAEVMAGQLGRFISRNIKNPDVEDEAMGDLARFLKDRQETLEKDGTPEREQVAYTAMVFLGVAETFGGFAADLSEAPAGRH